MTIKQKTNGKFGYLLLIVNQYISSIGGIK